MNPVQILMMNQQKSVNLGYGLLYNWYAGTDSRNIAPTGCHVPTDAEWATLITYLGGESVAGGKLKEVGLTHWQSPNTGATNESGFTGLPGGFRWDVSGTFVNIKHSGVWWTSTKSYSILSWVRILSSTLESIIRNNYENYVGLSIRCICDTSADTITDIDGNVYDTVVIGTQRWLVQNLKVTKYRNGDSIPEITDNSIWERQRTGALCAYNNDWNYV